LQEVNGMVALTFLSFGCFFMWSNLVLIVAIPLVYVNSQEKTIFKFIKHY